MSIENTGGKLIFEKVKWDAFLDESNRNLSQINGKISIETIDSKIKQGIISAAIKYISSK